MSFDEWFGPFEQARSEREQRDKAAEMVTSSPPKCRQTTPPKPPLGPVKIYCTKCRRYKEVFHGACLAWDRVEVKVQWTCPTCNRTKLWIISQPPDAQLPTAGNLYTHDVTRLQRADSSWREQSHQAWERHRQLLRKSNASDEARIRCWVSEKMYPLTSAALNDRFTVHYCRDLMQRYFPHSHETMMRDIEFKAWMGDAVLRVVDDPTFQQGCETLTHAQFASFKEFARVWPRFWYPALRRVDLEAHRAHQAWYRKERPRKTRWAKERMAIYERDKGVCWLCDKPAERLAFELDHVVPLAQGGRDDESNLSITHKECNRERSGSSLEMRETMKLDEIREAMKFR